jgi:hypothetical protein
MRGQGGPNNYGSFADFEREVLRPMHKVGFSLEDLESEASFKPGREDAFAATADELDFG